MRRLLCVRCWIMLVRFLVLGFLVVGLMVVSTRLRLLVCRLVCCRRGRTLNVRLVMFRVCGVVIVVNNRVRVLGRLVIVVMVFRLTRVTTRGGVRVRLIRLWFTCRRIRDRILLRLTMFRVLLMISVIMVRWCRLRGCLVLVRLSLRVITCVRWLDRVLTVRWRGVRPCRRLWLTLIMLFTLKLSVISRVIVRCVFFEVRESLRLILPCCVLLPLLVSLTLRLLMVRRRGCRITRLCRVFWRLCLILLLCLGFTSRCRLFRFRFGLGGMLVLRVRVVRLRVRLFILNLLVRVLVPVRRLLVRRLRCWRVLVLRLFTLMSRLRFVVVMMLRIRGGRW